MLISQYLMPLGRLQVTMPAQKRGVKMTGCTMLIPVGESPPFIEFSALASSAVLYAPMLVLTVKQRGERTANEIFLIKAK